MKLIQILCILIPQAAVLASESPRPLPVINEIHFEPPDKTLPEEFIELYNPADTAVDLSGWYFSRGMSYVFPEGVVLPAKGYLIIAEDPEAFERRFGSPAPVLGPYVGRLANEGEEVVLRDQDGFLVDRVDYKVGFPWPIAAAGKGSSLELVNPHSDNSLGGSWRSSGTLSTGEPTRRYFIEPQDPHWHYRKGTSRPPASWRELDFQEDDSWAIGKTSIGYGDGDDSTVLSDMRNNYSTVYFRHMFMVEGDIPEYLKIAVYSDDGAVVWINGREVIRVHAPPGELDYNDFGINHEAAWEEKLIDNPSEFLQPGENVVAALGLNTTLGSSDFSFDLALFVPAAGEITSGVPTPGRRNSVYMENPPPVIRQVRHTPLQPPEGEPLVVTAKITDPDGVASVLLHYQIVLPGHYIPAYFPLPHATLLANPGAPRPANPAFEDPANWTTIPMTDDGTGGDLTAGDGVYSATIPGQINRTLVRYRITASDSLGASVRVPYPDDKSLNFAAFVYNGVPPYRTTRASVHPEGAGHVYSAEVMNSLPVYILITRAEDYAECVAYDSAYQIPKSNEGARDKFNWEGAFVYNGVVYDHIRYRLRQANDRYGGHGKRSFRFRFNKGHYFQAHDNYGRPYPTKWRTLNTGKMFDNKRVGNFGLTEKMNHDLWNLVGVPAPFVHTFHFRLVRWEDEAPGGLNGQYYGDFQGMMLNFEDYDPRFLKAHNLQDGNLYKLKDGIFDGNELKRNQGRYAVTTDEDFQNIRHNLRPERSEDWLDAHVNYSKWYPYHTICEAVRHYDFRPSDTHSKNRAWYFEPDYSRSRYGRLWTLPWDSDASWGPSWNSGIDYSKNAIFANGGKERFKMEYRNVIREFRDLIWTEEVINQMIDDLAERIREFAMADRDRWRNAPAEVGYQDFGSLEAKVRDMKNFAFVGWSGSTGPTVPAGGRARHLDQLAAAEGEAYKIPRTPTVTYTGPPGFPADALTFAAGPYEDPQNDPFGAIAWRIGEITPPGEPFDPEVPRKYEYPAVWQKEFSAFVDQIQIPRTVIEPGHMYRVRVRMKDSTGRWSHWSEPVQFTAGEPTEPTVQELGLRITEIMFRPHDDPDLEFLELQNISDHTIDLQGVSISGGINFFFDEALIRTLEPGGYLILVRDWVTFVKRRNAADLPIAGQYEGALNDQGDHLVVKYGKTITILAFSYDPSWYPSTNGGGRSLVVEDPYADPALWSERGLWRPSAREGGSPGGPDLPEGWGLLRQGDINADGRLDISDAVGFLRFVLGGVSLQLPCGDGTLEDPSNRTLLDVNGDEAIDIADAVSLLAFLFEGGPPPARGAECLLLFGCPAACAK